MPKFAANLTMLFTEVPFLDRFERAAQAGFKAVEFQFPYAYSTQDIKQRLDTHGLTLVLHNLPAGDWDAGERGIACHPNRVEEFRAGVARAINYATTLGVRQLNCLAGKAPAGVSDAVLRSTLVSNLKYAAAALKGAGLRLLIEPINTYDIPGFYVSRTAQALEILDEVGADNAFVQYDIYHAQRMEGELAATLQKQLVHIGHIQLADNPGRNEPGTGEINYPFLFAHLDRIGYRGWIGCEYKPATSTEAGLGWRTQLTTPTQPPADPVAIQTLLRQMFEAAIASAQPALCLPPHLPTPVMLGKGRLVVIGAGKASAAMAHAVEDHWRGPLKGLVVTRYGYNVPCQHIEIVEASHPVPDVAGLQAAQRMLALVAGLSADDLVLCLISGGGSSLLPLPLAGLDLEDKQRINRALLASGATISEMNCVRRHLSAIKGGRLAAACYPARVLTLLISDVPGDDPMDIASGPTVADPTTCQEALDIVRRYGIDLPPAARALLTSGAAESVKPDDPRLAHAEVRMIATPQMALEAAAKVGRAAGLSVHLLGDALEGEARDVGKVLASMAEQVAQRNQPFSAPCVLLSGGETTVTVRGTGRGGRNVECLLSLGLTLNGHPRIHALAGDTDGVDGQEEIAGALWSPDTLARAWSLGLKPKDMLTNNDGHGFFEALGDAVITGPTRTNVNDFRAIYIAAP